MSRTATRTPPPYPIGTSVTAREAHGGMWRRRVRAGEHGVVADADFDGARYKVRWPGGRTTTSYPWHITATDEAARLANDASNSVMVRELADAAFELGGLALAFGRIDRTAVYHPDGVTPESDSDHTVMLGWVACAFAARTAPQLDLGLVAQFALVHDAVEVYAGDTPTLRIDENGRAAKAAREHAALLRLAAEFGDRLPWFPDTIAAYEAQRLPEARFVRALDKLMPKIVHLLDGAAGLVEQGMRRAELLEVFGRQRADMTRYAGEFGALLALHAELVARVVEQSSLADVAGED